MSTLKIKFCPHCGEKIKSKTSNFCDKCGICFKRECKSCQTCGFWEFCLLCGNKMSLTQAECKISLKPLSLNEPSHQNSTESEQDTENTLKRDIKSTNVEKNKIKVSILRGPCKIEVSQHQGGGKRVINGSKSSTYEEIFRNIIKLYFQNSSSSLGEKNDYKFTLLDINRNKISENEFETLEEYMTTYGLDFKKILFYLHLTKQFKLSQINQTMSALNSLKATNSTSNQLSTQKIIDTSSSSSESSSESSSDEEKITKINKPASSMKSNLKKRKQSNASDISSDDSCELRQKLVKKTNDLIIKNKDIIINPDQIKKESEGPTSINENKPTPKPTIESTINKSKADATVPNNFYYNKNPINKPLGNPREFYGYNNYNNNNNNYSNYRHYNRNFENNNNFRERNLNKNYENRNREGYGMNNRTNNYNPRINNYSQK